MIYRLKIGLILLLLEIAAYCRKSVKVCGFLMNIKGPILWENQQTLRNVKQYVLILGFIVIILFF